MRASMPHGTRAFRIVTAIAAAALLIAGCGNDDSSRALGDSDGFGEISLQYSWIKNEEFAGEFYAYDKGYYNDAGFST